MELRAEQITRSFLRPGKGTNIFCAVEPVDFVLPSGSLTAVIGRSGSGKTTFSNMLCGLLTPTEGKVLLDGKELYALPDAERARLRNTAFGIIPQGQTGLSSLTVLENVLAPAAMYGRAGESRKRAEELLGEMGILELSGVYSNELSGGELRRMSIARALLNEPSVLFADEPTGDLDDETTETVLKLLRDFADRGGAVLMVTHEKDALSYADRIFRMEKGRLAGEQ